MNQKFKINNLSLEFVRRCAEILTQSSVQNEELFNVDDDPETTKSLLNNALDQMNTNRLDHLDNVTPKQVSLAFKIYYQNLDCPLLTEDFINDFTAVARKFE